MASMKRPKKKWRKEIRCDERRFISKSGNQIWFLVMSLFSNTKNSTRHDRTNLLILAINFAVSMARYRARPEYECDFIKMLNRIESQRIAKKKKKLTEFLKMWIDDANWIWQCALKKRKLVEKIGWTKRKEKKSCLHFYWMLFIAHSIHSLGENVIESRRWWKEGHVMKWIRFIGSDVLN